MDFGTLPSFITGEKFLFFNLGPILFFQKDVKNTVCCNTVYELQPLKPIYEFLNQTPICYDSAGLFAVQRGCLMF